MSIHRMDVGPRMSPAVVHGKTVYFAGRAATGLTADVAGQIAQILCRTNCLRKEAGTDKTRILMRHDVARRHRDLRVKQG